MRIDVSEFRGHIPRVNPRKLPAQHAQLSVDARMLSGALEAWKDTELTFVLSKPVPAAWTLRTTLPQNGLDYDEVFINGSGRPAFGDDVHMLAGVRFPAAGGNDRPIVVTSGDGGLTWARADVSAVSGMPSDSVMELVAFGDGVFVGVCQRYGNFTGLRFCTSTDGGATWTAHNDGGFTAAAHVGAIAHNGQAGAAGLFVAVGRISGVSAIATSPDGVVWTQRGTGGFTRAGAFTSPAFPLFVEHNKQAGADGLWVAHSVLQVCTSPDGINWTERLAGTDGWAVAAFGAGTFVALAQSNSITTQKVKTSSDGITWIVGAISDHFWSSVAFGAGLFVAVSTDGTVMTSPDGITWTLRAAAAANAWNSVTYAASLGLFVAVASSGSGNRVMTSPDGIAWTIRVSAANNSWVAVTWSASVGLFVAIASSGVGNRVMTSPDGINWTIRVSASDSVWRCVGFGAGLFVALSSSTAGMTSPDGIVWTARTLPATSWQSIIFAESLFVASGAGAMGIITSADGITWSTPEDVYGATGAVVHDGATFVFLTFENDTYTSPDAVTWTFHPGYVNDEFGAGVTHNGLADPDGLWVIPFEPQEIPFDGTGFLTSPDAITWTFRHVGDPGVGIGGVDICGLAHNGLAGGQGRWLALINGGNFNYAFSLDGESWTATFEPVLFPYGDNPGVLGFGGGSFVGTNYDINLSYVFRSGVNPDVRWIYHHGDATLDVEHLTVTIADGGNAFAQAAQPRSSGQFYFEVVIDNMVGTNFAMGVAINDAGTGSPGNDPSEWVYIGSPAPVKRNNSVSNTYGLAFTEGDVIGVMLDADAGELSFSVNGADQGVAFTGVVGDAIGLLPRAWAGSTGDAHTARFTRATMQHIPDGFLAWDGT